MAMTRPPWGERGGSRGADGLALVRTARAAARLLHADPSEIRAVADRRAAEVATVARTVEPYRTLWAGLEEVRSVQDLSELPIIDRSDLQGVPFEARLTRPREGLTERSTSGTTGQPLITARTEEEGRTLDALMWRQLRAQGIPPEARRLSVDLERRRERADLEVAGNVLSLWMPESPEVVAQVVRSHQVEVLQGTPTCLVEVADLLAPTRLKALLTAGEVRTETDVDVLQRAFGVAPLDIYGSNEVSTVAWECRTRSGYHVNADSVAWTIVDEEGRPKKPGEPGDLIVTALWNRTAPVVRYRLADIASLSPDRCPCGISLPLLNKVEGRSMDWVIAPDGRRVSPFRVMLVTLLGEDVGPTLRRYRVIQRAPDDFLIEVVWANGRRQEIADRMEPAFSWTLDAPVRVECVDVPEIPLGPREKYRPVVPLVAAAARR